MQWLIGSVALVLFLMLAFQYAETRRRLAATLGVVAILGAAAAGFLLLERQQSAERQRQAFGRVTPADVEISQARLAREFGRWRVTGQLANRSDTGIRALTLQVRIKDCPTPESCEVVGETQATAYGLDVPPGASRPFDMQLYLPDLAQPKAMDWAYDILAIEATRE